MVRKPLPKTTALSLKMNPVLQLVQGRRSETVVCEVAFNLHAQNGSKHRNGQRQLHLKVTDCVVRAGSKLLGGDVTFRFAGGQLRLVIAKSEKPTVRLRPR